MTSCRRDVDSFSDRPLLLKGVQHLDPARAVGRVLQAELGISTSCHLTVAVENLDATVQPSKAREKRRLVGLGASNAAERE